MQTPRPKVSLPHVSTVIPEMEVIQNADGPPCVCVGACPWGAVTLELDVVGDRPDAPGQKKVWQVQKKSARCPIFESAVRLVLVVGLCEFRRPTCQRPPPNWNSSRCGAARR